MKTFGTDPERAIAAAIGLDGAAVTPSLLRRRLLARGEVELASHIREDEPEEPILLSLDSASFVEVRWNR